MGNLTRAVGDFAYKKDKTIGPEHQIITVAPDISTQDLLPQDEFLILGCDGVWDMKTSQEVVDLVKPRMDARAAGSKISSIVEDLLDELISKDPNLTNQLGCDNMTCVIVDLMADKRSGSAPVLEVLTNAGGSPPRSPNPKALSGNRRPTTVFGMTEEDAEAQSPLPLPSAER